MTDHSPEATELLDQGHQVQSRCLGEHLTSLNPKQQLYLLGAFQYVACATFMIDGMDLFICGELLISFFITIFQMKREPVFCSKIYCCIYCATLLAIIFHSSC